MIVLHEDGHYNEKKKSVLQRAVWGLIKVVLRVALFSGLAWLTLALLWAFLPSPTGMGHWHRHVHKHHEPHGHHGHHGHHGDDGPGSEVDQGHGFSGHDDGLHGYGPSCWPTAVLREGHTLTRVYRSEEFYHPAPMHRSGFALDYQLDFENLVLIAGEQAIPILPPFLEPSTAWFEPSLPVLARLGDEDGANLPWFRYADAVLLYWQIHEETVGLHLTVGWETSADGQATRMSLMVDQGLAAPLIIVDIEGKDASSIRVSVPGNPVSSSPSITYPLRVAIINVLAPVTIFLNEGFGPFLGGVYQELAFWFYLGFIVFCYTFGISCFAVAVMRTFARSALEDNLDAIEARLEVLHDSERYQRFVTRRMIDRLQNARQSKAYEVVVNLIRGGWHPERDAALAASEAAATTLPEAEQTVNSVDAQEKEVDVEVSEKEGLLPRED